METKLDLFAVMDEAMKPFTELVKLGAIHLNKPVWVRNGITTKNKIRITSGDVVGLSNGELTHETHENSFTIKQMRGTVNNTVFEIDLQDNNTKETITIKL